jgi:hypothetical protein
LYNLNRETANGPGSAGMKGGPKLKVAQKIGHPEFKKQFHVSRLLSPAKLIF